MVNRDRMIQEFLELVQIDSQPRAERGIADALIGKLQGLGLEVMEDGTGDLVGGNAGNVIARFAGNVSGASAVVFAAHMDRVTPGLGIKPVLTADAIYSDGSTILAADDLAGAVQMLEAVRQMQEQNIDHGDVELLFTISEEAGMFGAKNLDRSLLKAKYGYFLDGTGDVGTLINSAPAQSKIDVKVIGRPAHAGIEPEKGISAIVVVSDAISKMRLGRIDEETTCNIGTIAGGLATNIVAEVVELRCEVRSRNAAKLEAQVQHMVTEFEAAAARHGAKAEIVVTPSYPPMNAAVSEPVMQIALRAVEAMGLTPSVVPTGGGSDGNILAGKGLPSVVLGIGMEKVHSKEEFITIKQLLAGAELVVAIAQAAAKA